MDRIEIIAQKQAEFRRRRRKPTPKDIGSRRRQNEPLPRRLRRSSGVYTFIDINPSSIGFGYPYNPARPLPRAISVRRISQYGIIFGDAVSTLFGVPYPFAKAWAGTFEQPLGEISQAFGCNPDGDRAAGYNRPPIAVFGNPPRAYLFNLVDPPGVPLPRPTPFPAGMSATTAREHAFDINENGIVVGQTYDISVDPAGGTATAVALKWIYPNVYRLLPSESATSVAWRINKHNTIIGWRGSGFTMGLPPITYGAGLPFIMNDGGSYSTGNGMWLQDINDNGCMIGWHSPRAVFGGSVPNRSFFQDADGNITDIDTGVLGSVAPNYDDNTRPMQIKAVGMNNHNQVVGSYRINESSGGGNTRAFLWDPENGMIDMNTLFQPENPTGIILTEGVHINDNGDIAAQGYATDISAQYPAWAHLNRNTPRGYFGRLG
jgi:probable HAF family extracellular repeat protein